MSTFHTVKFETIHGCIDITVSTKNAIDAVRYAFESLEDEYRISASDAELVAVETFTA